MLEWTPPNPDYPPPKVGEPPLHRAARLGDHDAIRRLVAAGSPVDDPFDLRLDPGGRHRHATPLMVAAGSSDGATAATVRLLLDHGADPKAILDGHTAVSFACSGLGWNYRPGGDTHRLRVLLEAGCPLPSDPTRRNELLCDAAGAGDTERVSVLLERGVNADGYFDPELARRQHDRLMALTEDHQQQHPEVTEGMPEDYIEAMKLARRAINEELAERVASAPSHYAIPLFCAVESGSAECVQTLLDAGADPHRRDSSSRTALYYARTAEMIQLLGGPGLPIEDADQHGWSPLVAAVCDGIEAIDRIRLLIESGADVHATHDHGYTVFMSAVGSERHIDILRLLIAHGADPHAVSEYGYNAFHAAIDVNADTSDPEPVREIFGYLKDLGVDIEHRSKGGLTPLARAIREGTRTEVLVLCELGADPNAVCPERSCSGSSCEPADLPLLFHAATGGSYQSALKIRALLEAGADPRVKDADGYTALQRAAGQLCSECANPEDTYRQLMSGLSQVWKSFHPRPATRDDFIAAFLPMCRAFLESFAPAIPNPAPAAYAAEWRAEELDSIAILAAYAAWWARPTSWQP